MIVADDSRRVRRLVRGPGEDPYVVEIGFTGVVIRPYRSPKGGAREYRRSWAQIYVDAAGGDSLRARGGRKARGKR